MVLILKCCVQFVVGAFGNEADGDRNKLPPLALSRARELFPYYEIANDDVIVIGDTPKDIECAKVSSLSLSLTHTHTPPTPLVWGHCVDD